VQHQVASVAAAEATVGARAAPGNLLALSNVLYLAESSKLFAQRCTPVVCVTYDTARMNNAECAVFFCASGGFGVCLPPQLLPDINVDLKAKHIGVRVAEALAAKRGKRPSGDPMAATMHLLDGLHHSLSAVVQGGVHAFRAHGASEPATEPATYHLAADRLPGCNASVRP
jgi:hypothetical protein